MPVSFGDSQLNAIMIGDQAVDKVYLGGDIVYSAAPAGPAVPALSVPFHLWVARDIDLDAGIWVSRARPGDPTFELEAFGIPAIVTNLSWASGIPVLDATDGGFFGNRTAPNANDGFSLALVTNLSLTGLTISAWYQGGTVFSNSAPNQLRFPKLGGSARMIVGNGGGGSGRAVNFAETFTDQDIVQWDAPAGALRLVSAISAYRNGTALTQTTPGTAGFNAASTRLVLGGQMNGAGALETVPTVRLLAAFYNTNGVPLNSTDRATLNTFLQGLRAGTIS